MMLKAGTIKLKQSLLGIINLDLKNKTPMLWDAKSYYY
jgi:hypothetical protein